MFKFADTSVEIPPSKCWTYEFALDSAYIEPTHKSFEKISVKLKPREKIINKIIDINDCKSNNEIKVRSHVLKNHEVVLFNSVKKAKGVNNTNTLIMIYLRAYENNKFSMEIDVKLFKRPSKENKLNVFCSISITEFKLEIKFENDTVCPKIFLPIAQIDPEIK